jgi:tyrosyl-tRNA synthetase
MVSVIDFLEKRQCIDAVSSPDLSKYFEEPRKVYCGFDPTADSLHLGNMVAMMGLAFFQKFGHTPVIILGGATGMIGDPSGRSKERNLLDEEEIAKNIKGIEKNFAHILDFNHPTAKPIFLNNMNWFKNFSFIEFLRDVGKYFRMGQMLAKESVKTRLVSDEGLSFTEFSYQLLQAYDFYHLYKAYGVTLQLGGADQWGNLIAGKDYVKKSLNATVHVLTFPLLTRSDGKKFGKTEDGAIWLAKEKCSPYELYQYLYRLPDKDVISLMRALTFMEEKEIEDFQNSFNLTNYTPNTAQKRLAEEVTKQVHGIEGLKEALSATMHARPGQETLLDLDTFTAMSKHLPLFELEKKDVLEQSLVDLICTLKLQPSKGAAKKLLANGGVYLNNERVISEEKKITVEDFQAEGYMLLAVGKKNKVLIKTI